MSIQNVLTTLNNRQAQMLQRLQGLISKPSVSTDPEARPGINEAVEYLRQDLLSIGFKVEVVSTESNPVIVATMNGPGPHVMFYGHYDVQPEGDRKDWDFSPFDSEIRQFNDREVITGRGASDDKGQVMAMIEAVRAIVDVDGHLPCQLTVIIEGDEENNPQVIDDLIKAHKKLLETVDCVLICDTNAWDNETPAITTSLRGIAACEITLVGPSMDCHSGMYGGVVANPLQGLAKVLASLHDDNSVIQVPGFYDDMFAVDKETLKQWHGLAFDEQSYLKRVGMKLASGDPNTGFLERLWGRPTCEINGVIGGYTGIGIKTIIPSHASAKITCRLVSGQDPDRVLDAIESHVKKHCPKQLKLKFKRFESMGASIIKNKKGFIKQCIQAVEDEWGVTPKSVGMGGSIPVVTSLTNHLDADVLLLGFGRPEDLIHSPNENFSVKTFVKAANTCARFLYTLNSQ